MTSVVTNIEILNVLEEYYPKLKDHILLKLRMKLDAYGKSKITYTILVNKSNNEKTYTEKIDTITTHEIWLKLREFIDLPDSVQVAIFSLDKSIFAPIIELKIYPMKKE